MKRSGSGRVARKVGSYDEDSTESTNSSQNEASQPTVVKRPTLGKSKKRSSLRISFGPGDDANDGDESSDAAVTTPKKSNLSRIALEKSAQLRVRSPLIPGPAPEPADDGRPSYNKDYIDELRKSTPSTPRDLKLSAEEEEQVRALDIASKFGPISSLPIETSAIPTEAEIQEKKDRRKRLAQQEKALDDENERLWASDDEGEDEFRLQTGNEISFQPKEKYADTRLIHEDEDIAEGFDDFVEDGRISLGRKSEREAQRKRRAEMAELINDAEGSDDESMDSDEERNAAFAAAQTRAGRYGQKIESEDDGSKTPPRIAPLPDLDEVLGALSIDVRAKQQRKELILQKLQEFKEDKVRIEERKKYLQEQLQKTGEEYEKLRQEAGLPALPANGVDGGRLLTERGLESMGTTPLVGRSSEDSSDE